MHTRHAGSKSMDHGCVGSWLHRRVAASMSVLVATAVGTPPVVAHGCVFSVSVDERMVTGRSIAAIRALPGFAASVVLPCLCFMWDGVPTGCGILAAPGSRLGF